MQEKTQNFVVIANDSNLRLDKWLTNNFNNITNSQAQKLIRTGWVRINTKKVDFKDRVQEGDVVRVPILIINGIKNDQSEKKPVNINNYKTQINNLVKSILYKDEDYIILNKPAGLSVQGGSGVLFSVSDALEFLKFELDNLPYIVHRIDKETSGILILARNRQSANHMLELFKNKEINKQYLAIVYPVLISQLNGQINAPLFKDLTVDNQKVEVSSEGKEAITNYNILKKFKNVALIEFNPLTGRTHQIRVHVNYFFKASILGDYKYNFNKNSFINNLQKNFKFSVDTINAINIRNMYLHAIRVQFKTQNNKEIDVSCPLPDYFKNTQNLLFIND